MLVIVVVEVLVVVIHVVVVVVLVAPLFTPSKKVSRHMPHNSGIFSGQHFFQNPLVDHSGLRFFVCLRVWF